ncbi:MAG: hypothetical protein ACLQVD_01230 [Capsulimonadaceae bacterium]
MGDTDVTWLQVFSNPKGGLHPAGRPIAVNDELFEARSGIWVPGHGHWLVVACSGEVDYLNQKGEIALWTGSRFRTLCRPVEPDTVNLFAIVGVTRDGKTLVYTHLTYPGGPAAANRWRTLALPRR